MSTRNRYVIVVIDDDGSVSVIGTPAGHPLAYHPAHIAADEMNDTDGVNANAYLIQRGE